MTVTQTNFVAIMTNAATAEVTYNGFKSAGVEPRSIRNTAKQLVAAGEIEVSLIGAGGKPTAWRFPTPVVVETVATRATRRAPVFNRRAHGCLPKHAKSTEEMLTFPPMTLAVLETAQRVGAATVRELATTTAGAFGRWNVSTLSSRINGLKRQGWLDIVARGERNAAIVAPSEKLAAAMA